MQLVSFRIENFRSIIDTGWVNCSNDNLTALVGQNESGKTAILAALAVTFSGKSVDFDDIRYGEGYPLILAKVAFEKKEWIDASLWVKSTPARNALVKYMEERNGIVSWRFETSIDSSDATKMTTSYGTSEPVFEGVIADLVKNSEDSQVVPELLQEKSSSMESVTAAINAAKNFISYEALVKETVESATEFTDGLFQVAPVMTLFHEALGLLPNKIDINDDLTLPNVIGATAAHNFLTVAGIDLNKLVSSDSRGRAAILKAANKRITEGFLGFWTQTVGRSSPLQLECEIHQHPAGHPSVGKSYLQFLITDNSGPLYPGQRSQGTRWFISFYLQMSASEIGGRARYYLIDEPGSNLHEKAQKDVLAFLEKVKSKVGIIYSTHIPHLLDENALHRILAVERDPTHPMHPTKIIGSHALGAANADTLSPIFTVMGSNFSRQTTIKRHNNVILEELSSQYYFRSFWKLLKCGWEVNFLPATGVSNVYIFANLLLGWGLDFIVVVDDEPSGRNAFNQLKRDMFLDSQQWADRRLCKVKDCEGIEDIFTPSDYAVHVLDCSMDKLNKSNARWAKANGAAKAMHAMRFLHKVEKGELMLADLHVDTQGRIRALVSAIETRLKDYAGTPPVGVI